MSKRAGWNLTGALQVTLLSLFSLLSTSERDLWAFLREERYSVKELNTVLRGVSHRFGWEFWAQVTQRERIWQLRISMRRLPSAVSLEFKYSAPLSLWR